MTRGCHLTLQSAGVTCAFVALLVYLNTLDCGICFDDEPAIKNNKDLHPGTPWSRLLSHDFWGQPLDSPSSHKSYRPLCVATFRLNYLLHELQPMGYHLVNVLLHSAVCFLYVQLCGVVLGEVWPALIAGLLFAVHPIHTEAVAGLVGRAELLSAIFYVGAFLSYVNAIQQQNNHRIGWLTLTSVLSLCSLFSKEQGITIVAVCLVYDFFVANKMDLHTSLKLMGERPAQSQSQKWLKRFFRRALAMSVFTLAAIMLRFAITNGGPSKKVFHMYVNPPTALQTPYRQLSWLYLCFVNLWLLLSPSRLLADWRFGAVPVITSVTDPHNLLTLATFAAVAVLAVYCLRGNGQKQKMVLFGLSLLVLPYIPASNLFFPVGFVVAERVLYLPSMGFTFLVGFGVWQALKLTAKNTLLKTVLRIGIAYLLAVHSSKTLIRNRDWYSGFLLYSSGIRQNPNSGIFLSNLGIDYAMMKNYSFAEQLFRSATVVAPHYSKGFFHLGKVMFLTNRYNDAEEPLRKAIELGIVDTSTEKVAETFRFLIGAISKDATRLEEALELCDEAISMYPHHAKLYAAKGGILLKLNRNNESIPVLEVAIRKNPGLAVAHYNLGLALSKLGDKLNAEKALQRVLLIDSGSTYAKLQLGVLLHDSSDEQKLKEAEQLLLDVISSEPQNPEALFYLAELYLRQLQYHKAQEAYMKVVQVQTGHKRALYNLGLIHYRFGEYDKAINALSRIREIDPNNVEVANLLQLAQDGLRLSDAL